MATFVSDTFTDTNNTLLSAHTPDTGSTWTKISGSGSTDLKIFSNKLENKTLSFSLMIYANDAAPGSADYDVQFDMTTTAENSVIAGLVGYLTDSSNHYRAYYASDSTDVWLRKVVGGSGTTLDFTDEDLGVGTVDFKLELTDAPTQKVYVDDVEKLSSTDSALAGPGKAGMIMFQAATEWTFDNFLAGDTGAPVATTASMQPMHAWWQRT